MKNYLLIIVALNTLLTYSQMALPINFEDGQVTTESFVDFNGGTGTVVDNPFNSDDNPSNTVGKIVRDGGDIWAGSYLIIAPIDFSTGTTIKMSVYSVSPGLLVKLKLEDDNDPVTAATERDAYTTKYNQWETLTWSFTGEQSDIFQKLVLMFDFGTTGDGTESSTFYFDDIYQFDPTGGLAQIDLPVTFDDSSVYYSLIDFEGNGPSTIEGTSSGKYARVEKSSSSGTSAGVTIGTESGFATAIAISPSNSKMYVHTNVSGNTNTGIPVRLKIENSNDPTQSVETEAFTTVVNAWEILEFDFNNEATGTAEMNPSYTYNKASLFFDFGSVGDDSTVYLFDNISFGTPISLGLYNVSVESFKLYPNPVKDHLYIQSFDTSIKNVDIYNISGKKIYSINSSDRLDMSSYSAGIYFVKVNNSTYKIVKK